MYTGAEFGGLDWAGLCRSPGNKGELGWARVSGVGLNVLGGFYCRNSPSGRGAGLCGMKGLDYWGRWVEQARRREQVELGVGRGIRYRIVKPRHHIPFKFSAMGY